MILSATIIKRELQVTIKMTRKNQSAMTDHESNSRSPTDETFYDVKL